ncbi:MAG: hypothetical protein E2P06_15805 [Acidobacteria bacterium]|nr:MAG: hypothetical protein E2P06_15805 [Acidobacteriota bacterium]
MAVGAPVASTVTKTMHTISFLNTMRSAGCTLLLVTVAMLWTQQGTGAQLTYRSGQPVSAAYEGWEEDPDGSRYFLFGYMNANWDEEPDVPVGPDNYFVFGEPGAGGADAEAFDPAVADQGQPTHFLPRRNRFVFRVPIPDGFRESDEVIWTLSTHGKTVSAYASLRLDYRVDSMVKASEQGAIGAGTTNPTIRANTAPELSVEGETTRTVRVGEPLMLVAFASDDGVPKATEPRRNTDPFGRPGPDVPRGWMKPRQITVNSATGLRLSWYLYRGAGTVTFAPEQTKVWEDTRVHANSPWATYWYPPPVPPDGKFEVEVTFDEPGTYVLRCLVSDGALGADSDVTVTVIP